MALKNKLQDSRFVLNSLLIFGFVVLVWLVIFGNLKGNTGFSTETDGYYNQTINLTPAGSIPAGASGKINPVLSNIIVTNATGGKIVQAANYTVTGVTFTNATAEFSNLNVNVSYTIVYDSEGKVNTDEAIGNLTRAAKTYTTYNNTIFTILAITILVTALVGVLLYIMKITRKKGKLAE